MSVKLRKTKRNSKVIEKQFHELLLDKNFVFCRLEKRIAKWLNEIY